MDVLFNTLNCKYIIEDEEFLKNGIKITNENGDKLPCKDVKNNIKKEVHHFINKSFANVIVLVGAGASVVTNNEKIDINFGKTVFMIAQNIFSELNLNEEYFSLKEVASLCKHNIGVTNMEDDGTEKLNSNFNLENFLSDMLSYEKFVEESIKDKYIKTKKKIFEIIKHNTSYEFDENKLKHAAFIKVMSKYVKTPNKLTMVTTNYDTIIEDAAEHLKYTVMDGFSFSHKPYFDADMFDWHMVREVENVKTKELEYKKNIINLLKLHGSLTWEKDDKGILKRDKNDVSEPIMIFPSSNKYMQTYREPYFELFTKFQELLKRPNTLLITTGFSFADDHISKMITQAILHNHSLITLVTDYNITQNNSNWKVLEEMANSGYQIAFLKATMNEDLVYYVGEYYED